MYGAKTVTMNSDTYKYYLNETFCSSGSLYGMTINIDDSLKDCILVCGFDDMSNTSVEITRSNDEWVVGEAKFCTNF